MKDEQISQHIRELGDRITVPLSPTAKARVLSGLAEARPKPNYLRRRLIFAAAGAAVLLIGLFLARPHLMSAISSANGPLLTVIAVQQPAAIVDGSRLQIGDRISAGATVQTGRRGRLTLITRHGSEFTLNAGTELAFRRSVAKAELLRGELYCRSRQHEIKRISSVAGEIHLLGTTLDAAVQNQHSVAVTVIEGAVRLLNARGETTVPAGKRAVMIAARPPAPGVSVNTAAETAWYQGRTQIVSDFGDIAYIVHRKSAEATISEVWAMRADGTGKRLIKSYVGYVQTPGPWLPGQQWLYLYTHGLPWGRPSLEKQQATGGFGIVPQKHWLLNAATGQDVEIQIPPQYRVPRLFLSPDGTRALVWGAYYPNYPSHERAEGGLWLYDLATGGIRKIGEHLAAGEGWSPDGRLFATQVPESQYAEETPLRLLEVDSNQTSDLGVRGEMPSFSPDGKRLTYMGDFKNGRGGHFSNRIYVLDLETREAKAITPICDSAVQPLWSPDGTRIVYQERHDIVIDPDNGPVIPAYALFVANADGSSLTKIFQADNEAALEYSWAPSGDALYVTTNRGVRLVSADGAGVIAELGGTEEDSVLSPQQATQMKGVNSALQEALFHYAVGKVRGFEGQPSECTTAFAKAAEIFARLPWEYPLARLSAQQLLPHADDADRLAARTPEQVISDSCEERLKYAGTILTQCATELGQFPADLAALEKWSATGGWGINWFNYKDTKWADMIFRCPEDGEWIYTPPSQGDPKVGEVLLQCRIHPDNKVIWTERDAERLGFHRQSVAHRKQGK